jgi:indole-3-glycerol phosphate synthase
LQNLLNHGRTPALDELYDYAQNCGIGVFDFHLPESRAVTLADSQGQCVIGIDNRDVTVTQSKRQCLRTNLATAPRVRCVV